MHTTGSVQFVVVIFSAAFSGGPIEAYPGKGDQKHEQCKFSAAFSGGPIEATITSPAART